MSQPDGFDAMANDCLALHEQIIRWGSPEMQIASRMLLLALADEVRRREQSVSAQDDDA